MSLSLPFWGPENILAFLSSYGLSLMVLDRLKDLLYDEETDMLKLGDILLRAGLTDPELHRTIDNEWKAIRMKMLTPSFVLNRLKTERNSANQVSYLPSIARNFAVT
jgi:hypothetical protein